MTLQPIDVSSSSEPVKNPGGTISPMRRIPYVARAFVLGESTWSPITTSPCHGESEWGTHRLAVAENDRAPGISGSRDCSVVAFLDADAQAAPDWLEMLVTGYLYGTAWTVASSSSGLGADPGGLQRSLTARSAAARQACLGVPHGYANGSQLACLYVSMPPKLCGSYGGPSRRLMLGHFA
jgi:hypothetical protein